MPDSGRRRMPGIVGDAGRADCEVPPRRAGRALLPRGREASDETLLVADGFSCREQIERSTHRSTRHLADVLALAMRGGEPAPVRHNGKANGARIALLTAGSLIAGASIAW